MNRSSQFVALLALLVLPTFAMSREASDAMLSRTRAAAVDAAVETEMRRDRIVGLAVGVIENDRIAYLKGYGQSDRENHVPVTTQTLFRWASVSKPVTAIVAMQLVERGKLDLDADVRRYVPEFPDKGATITTRELLGHLGGIVHYDNGPVIPTHATYVEAHPFADTVVALDTFKDSPLVNAPGMKYAYSTHGYMLIGAVVQRAGGEPFAQQVRERVIAPLHLSTMQPDYQWLDIAQRAVGYRLEGDAVVRSGDTDVSWKLPGGGYLSNIGDFARFAKGLIDHRLVSAHSEAMMWTRQTLPDGTQTGYGLGFQLPQEEGHFRVAHSGSQEKTRTMLVIYPNEGRGVVVMTNSEWADPNRFADLVLTALAAPGAAK